MGVSCTDAQSTEPAPRLNPDYWLPKLERNVQRDRETDDLLKKAGWLSIRIWEHEDLEAAATNIAEAVRTRRTATANP